jgi:hypothetical protein
LIFALVFIGDGKFHNKTGAFTFTGNRPDAAFAIMDNSVTYGKTQSGALTHFFGSKKGLEYPL